MNKIPNNIPNNIMNLIIIESSAYHPKGNHTKGENEGNRITKYDGGKRG